MTLTLLYPMTVHIGLTILLYALLTLARVPSVWGPGRLQDGSNPWAVIERRISANLSNQFEWPLFFYVVSVLLIALQAVDSMQIWLAWIFIAGRVAHSGVQVFTTNVRLRGIVFTINFLAVLGMWARLVLTQSSGVMY